MVSSCEARYGGGRNQTQILSLIFVSSATTATTFLTQNRFLFKENSAFIFGQKCPRFENVFFVSLHFLWLVSRCRKSRQLSLQSIYNSLPTRTLTQRPPHPLQMEWLCSLWTEELCWTGWSHPVAVSERPGGDRYVFVVVCLSLVSSRPST